MKKLFTFLFSVCVCSLVMAQTVKPDGIVKKATVKPVIDGVIDDVWATANQYNVTLPFKLEVPTLGAIGTTYWKGLWDEDGFYILVVANDDYWDPYFLLSTGNTYDFDMVELYFDTNQILDDKLGGTAGVSGNRQIAPNPGVGKVDGSLLTMAVQTGTVQYAINANDAPMWICEYFVPWDAIPDKDGIMFDKTGTMGFDVDITDRDPANTVRNRALWSNDGTRGVADENWNNMDEAGHITFDGAVAAINIEAITITGGQVITTDNGTVQFTATLSPIDATQAYKWVVTNGTGEATINKDGVVTAIRNGTVLVKAMSGDGFVESSETTVTISNQIVTHFEVSYLKDGDFNQGTGTTASAYWQGGAVIMDGVAECTNPAVAAAPNPWDWTFSQMMYVPFAAKDSNYVFSFKAWADAPRTFTVDMEDVANGYPRYGVSTDATSTSGTSDWTFDLTTEPTVYNLHVTFTNMLATASQKMNFMLGLATPKVYIDSVYLVTKGDFILSAKELKTSSSLRVYPSPMNNMNQLTVELSSLNAKVAIYNSLGQKLMEKVATGTIAKFDVSSLTKGMYFVRLSDGTSQKFIK